MFITSHRFVVKALTIATESLVCSGQEWIVTSFHRTSSLIAFNKFPKRKRLLTIIQLNLAKDCGQVTPFLRLLVVEVIELAILDNEILLIKTLEAQVLRVLLVEIVGVVLFVGASKESRDVVVSSNPLLSISLLLSQDDFMFTGERLGRSVMLRVERLEVEVVVLFVIFAMVKEWLLVVVWATLVAGSSIWLREVVVAVVALGSSVPLSPVHDLFDEESRVLLEHLLPAMASRVVLESAPLRDCLLESSGN